MRPLLLLVLVLALAPALQAQTYPAKPIRLIVPAIAGGGADVPARILTNTSQQLLAAMK